MKLDVNNWKEYRLGDLFDIKKGKRLTSEDQTEGSTPYIGAIDSNNGIANYIGQEATHVGNTISLSYNGSVGEAFYQPMDFWATDDVNVLYFKSSNGVAFNQHLALFICTILRKEKYRYCYGRKWVLESMNETRIKLPTKDNVPDWEWMENYVKSLHHKPLTTEIKSEKDANFNTNAWKEFYLHKLFVAGMGNGIDAIQTTCDDPKYNYVSRDSNGNGVVGFVDEIDLAVGQICIGIREKSGLLLLKKCHGYVLAVSAIDVAGTGIQSVYCEVGEADICFAVAAF